MAEKVKFDDKRASVLAEYVEMMKGLYGEELVSLNLFGEGAVEPPGQGGHHIKMLAVMTAVGPAQLGRYASVSAKWQKKGIPPPLMLTAEMLETSTDVFPMEFLEMKDAYVLLYGRDVLAGLEIGLDNLRREIEEQVKGKLIHLQQAYMEAGGDKKALSGLISSSVEPFCEIMRNAIRLKEDGAPVHKEPIIKQFCKGFGLDEAPFLEALGIRRLGLMPSRDELDALYARYLGEVTRMVEKIDKFTSSV